MFRRDHAAQLVVAGRPRALKEIERDHAGPQISLA